MSHKPAEQAAWDRIRETARLKHLSLRTEQAYIQWIRRFWIYHRKQNLKSLGVEHIRSFLTHLAVKEKISASTQNQALCAILFLYKQVLCIDLPLIDGIERAHRKRKIPVIFSRDEARSVLNSMSGTHALMAKLLYGSGLRLTESLRLRIKDVDFNLGQIIVRDGKGETDRVTILPNVLVQPLQRHIAKVKLIHEEDLAEGFGEVYLPYALNRKYRSASRSWE